MTDILATLREKSYISPPRQPQDYSCTIGKDVIAAAADEIERLRADLALLGPVTTPLSGELCASCVEPMAQHWTYCPYCGAQGRLNEAGEKLKTK